MSGMEHKTARKNTPYKQVKISNRKSAAGRRNIPWNKYVQGRQAKMLAHIAYEMLVGLSAMEAQRNFGNLACQISLKLSLFHIPKFKEWFMEHSGGVDPEELNEKHGVPQGAYLLYQRVYNSFRHLDAVSDGRHLTRSKEHYMDPSQMETLRVWEDWARKAYLNYSVRGDSVHGVPLLPYSSNPVVTARPLKESLPERAPPYVKPQTNTRPVVTKQIDFWEGVA